MKYLRKIINFLMHKRTCILDTNILILREKERPDNRIRKLPRFLGSLSITEFVETERRALVTEKKYVKIFSKITQTLFLESLRNVYPDSCLLFTNFIVGMHGPAHITSPFFLIEVFTNLEKTGYRLSNQQQRIKMLLSDMIARSARGNLSGSGKQKSEQAKLIDEAYQKYTRKKRRADPAHKNYLNDYKTLSLSLINCLLGRLNTTFITADSDIIIAVCNLSETITQQMAFKYFILEKIKQPGVVRLWRGKEKFRFTMKFDDFQKMLESLLRDTFALSPKESCFFFRVVYWDQRKQKYIECLRLNFDDEIRDMLLHLHGHLACPFVKNSDYGNMFRYKYELTPEMSLNIEVSPKTIRNSHYVKANEEQHKRECEYVKQWEGGDFRFFTEFEPPNWQRLFDRK